MQELNFASIKIFFPLLEYIKMKAQFFYLLALLAMSACSSDTDVFVPGDVKEPMLPVVPKPNENVMGEVFEKINLDYPGLEKVKSHYEAQEHYMAAYELLQYYVKRGNILNPQVNLISPSVSAVEKNKADQALDYRFCVAKYVEKKGETEAQNTYYSFKNDDGSINWGYKPDDSSVDREFYYQQHRHQWMEPQAKAYSVTKDEKYVKSWIDVYSSWMKAYPCPNKAFDNPTIKDLEEGYEWKGLQVAERVLSQLNIFQYYLSSSNLTPEWLTVFLNSFQQSVEMIRMNYYSEGNIRITQGQAVAAAGILFPEFRNAALWVSDGLQAMDIDKQFREDGVHCDLDFSYHMGAIADYLELYELAKRNGKLSSLPANYITKLEGAVDFAQDMIYPDYTIDNFNDTRSSSFSRGTLQNRLREYLDVFPTNENLRWLAWEGQKGGVKSNWTSKVYPNSGYYMFRSKDWDSNQRLPKGVMMIYKNNDNRERKWHCQPDNGTVSLWYDGLNLLPDAGVYSYNDPSKERSLYRQSTMHNTLSVHGSCIDESQQLGRFLLHKSTKDYELVVTENTPYKANVKIKQGSYVPKGDIKHRRSVFFVHNEFFVIVDEAYSTSKEETAEINLNYHLYSEGKEAVVDKVNKTVFSGLSEKNLFLKVFSETNQKFTIYQNKKEDVKVSNVSMQTIGNTRNWITINEQMTPDKAVRMITVLYPTGKNPLSENIEAHFTDNTPEEEGTVHQGLSVNVKVGNADFPLSYVLK